VSGATDLLRKINDQRWTEAQIRVHTTQHEARYEYIMMNYLFVCSMFNNVQHDVRCVHHTLRHEMKRNEMRVQSTCNLSWSTRGVERPKYGGTAT